MSQHGWVLSPSDDDDCCVITMETSNQDKNQETKVDDEYYVPLSKRLKPTQKYKEISSNSDDDLPVFNINKGKEKSSVHQQNKDIEPYSAKNTSQANFNSKSQSAIKANKKMAKDKLLAEKHQRKILQNHVKTLRPAECLKYITCQVSDLIPSMFDGSNLLQKFSQESEATFQFYSTNHASIKWKRKVLVENAVDQFISNDESEMAVLLNSRDFVKMVWNESNADENSSFDDVSLTSWLKNFKLDYPDFKIHPIIYGIKEYRKKIKRKQRADFKRQLEILSENTLNTKNTQKPKKRDDEPLLLENEIEQILVELQVMHKTSVKFVNSVDEFVMLIVQMTKAIAEAPFKKMNQQDGAIVLDIPTVKVNPNTGEGSKKCWKMMIQQFENVSPDMSSAIVEKYPSVQSLLTAYKSCSSDNERLLLLEDLVVRRGIGTIQSRRRIGPALSKKIFMWATTKSPDKII